VDIDYASHGVSFSVDVAHDTTWGRAPSAGGIAPFADDVYCASYIQVGVSCMAKSDATSVEDYLADRRPIDGRRSALCATSS